MNKNIIAVDFDSTLAIYSRPFKYNLLGQPIEVVIEVVQRLYNEGYYILIFTGRLSTPELADWLKKYKVPYHSINNNPAYHQYASRFKPYFSIILDDKAVNPMDINGDYKSPTLLYLEIKEILKRSVE